MQDRAEFRGFLDILRRRRGILLRSILCALALAGLFLYIAKPNYTAQAMILVDQAQKNLLEADPLRNSVAADNAYIESQVEILRSPALAKEVVARADLINDPDYAYAPGLIDRVLEWTGLGAPPPETRAETLGRVLSEFQENTSIARRGLNYVISVTIKSGDADRAAELANLLATIYIDEQLKVKVVKTLAARDILQSQIDQETQMATSAKTALARLKSRETVQTLTQRMTDLDTQAKLQVPDSRIVSEALPPVKPSGPGAVFIIAAALVAGGLVGLALVYVTEIYVDGVNSAEQLAEMLDLPEAQTVPVVRRRFLPAPSPGKLVIKRPLSQYSDAVRRLRASIDQSTAGQPLSPGGAGREKAGQVVLMASSVPGEGKSTLALSLARVYAQAGLQTLLIDADMRKPRLHRYAGVRTKIGLADFLRRPDKYELPVVHDPKSDLALMPGKRDARLSTDDLAGSELFARVLAGARVSFDVVVIDSPPVIPAADARYLAAQADAVVLTVKHASTGRRLVRRAAQALLDAMPPHASLTAVLNQHQAYQAEYDYAAYHKSPGLFLPQAPRRLGSPNA